MDPTDLPLISDPTADAIRVAIQTIAEAFRARDWPRLVGWVLAGIIAAANVADVLRAARGRAWAYHAAIVALGTIEGFVVALVAGSAWTGAAAAALAALLVTLATPSRRARIVGWYDSGLEPEGVAEATRRSGWGRS